MCIRDSPYLESNILPSLQNQKNVFIAAHGNSLRSIVMSIEGLSQEEVLTLEIPTGKPLIYEWSQTGWTRK